RAAPTGVTVGGDRHLAVAVERARKGHVAVGVHDVEARDDHPRGAAVRGLDRRADDCLASHHPATSSMALTGISRRAPTATTGSRPVAASRRTVLSLTPSDAAVSLYDMSRASG